MTIKHHLHFPVKLTIKVRGRRDKNGKTVNFLQHCAHNRNDIISCVRPNKAAIDNQLLANMNWVLYKTVIVLCRVLTSAQFPLTIVFVDASQFKLIWNVFQLLIICLFTHSHKSAVLVLLLCVVLVRYSYQESTLLWRPWIPFIKIKLGVMSRNVMFLLFSLMCTPMWLVIKTEADNLTWLYELMHTTSSPSPR